MQHFVRLHAPNIVAVEQPVQLLAGQRQHRLIAAPRPVKTMPLQALVPNHDGASIYPLRHGVVPQLECKGGQFTGVGQMARRHVVARQRNLSVSAVFVALAYFAAASAACAQDIEPRKWSETPVGVNFLIAGYAYTQGGISFDPSLPINNPHVETNDGGLGFARSLDLWGFSGKFDASVPYTWLSGSADYLGRPVQRTISGFGDPEFELSVNLYGAPAVGMKDFASYKQDWIVGAALAVSAPSGQYEDTRLVNIATHRIPYSASRPRI